MAHIFENAHNLATRKRNCIYLNGIRNLCVRRKNVLYSEVDEEIHTIVSPDKQAYKHFQKKLNFCQTPFFSRIALDINRLSLNLASFGFYQDIS